MSGTAVQRGSLALADGDPETPNWPSLDNVYRLDEEDRAEYLPSIPVQPIGYDDAWVILSNMTGKYYIYPSRIKQFTIGRSGSSR